jgi:hypothetical protein
MSNLFDDLPRPSIRSQPRLLFDSVFFVRRETDTFWQSGFKISHPCKHRSLACSTKWSLELSRATPISCRREANPVKNPRQFSKSINPNEAATCLQGKFGSELPFNVAEQIASGLSVELVSLSKSIYRKCPPACYGQLVCSPVYSTLCRPIT